MSNLLFILVFLFLIFIIQQEIVYRKGFKEMAVVYATLIINGKKTLEDVPVLLKEDVRQILIDLGIEI